MYASSPKSPRDYIPLYMYSGDYLDGKYHGEGTLYKRCPQGLVKYFIGTFHENLPLKGKVLYPSQKIRFEGTLKDEKMDKGVHWDEHGLLLWEGSFENEQPHGLGNGLFEGRFFQGLCNKGQFVRGTLSNSDGTLVYEGYFENGTYHGPGKTTTEIGDYSNGNLLFGLQMKKHVVDARMMYRYVGYFRDTKWHGMGALFVRIPAAGPNPCLVKLVGLFDNGHRHGTFEVFATDDRDPLLHPFQDHVLQNSDATFSTTTFSYGELRGTMEFYNGIHTGDITEMNLNGMHFSGSGYLGGDGTSIFVRHGPGTVFVRGLPRYTAMFVENMPIHFQKVYDEAGELMFESMDIPADTHVLTFLDPDQLWPAVHGLGKIYVNGHFLYTGRFSYGLLQNAKAILNSMKEMQIPYDSEMRDFISLEEFSKGSIAVVINEFGDKKAKPLSMESFLSITNAELKDPLRGAYPGLRFRKVVLW